MAICKSQNGESANGMKEMMGMWGSGWKCGESLWECGMPGIRVGMRGMRRIMVGMWETGGGNEGNKGENLVIRMELMNYYCGEGHYYYYYYFYYYYYYYYYY